jgi:DNA-3-methyladenine glycosylase
MTLQRQLYQKNVIEVAKGLLGKILVHQSAEGTSAGRIVETEAYCGPEDQGSHSFGGRRTPRNDVMFGEKGFAYVYFIYGKYYCINITAGSVPGKPEAVLIRALEPTEGEDIMAKRRGLAVGRVDLTNGPGKLCMAMGITKVQNKTDMTSPPLYITESPNVLQEDIVESTRIGIDYAGDWKNMFWRFYIKENRFVSRR